MLLVKKIRAVVINCMQMEKAMSKSFFCVFFAIFFSVTLIVPKISTAAIGVWLGGTVTASPWQENGYYNLIIDGVRYTVMEEATVQAVTSKDGMSLKNFEMIQNVKPGDSVLVQHSGNRIYAVEINR